MGRMRMDRSTVSKIFVESGQRAALAVALAVVLGGCGAEPDSPEADQASAPPRGPAGNTAQRAPGANPLAGRVLYVSPNSGAATQVASWESERRTEDAKVLRRIGDRPMAHWVTGQVGSVGGDVDRVLGLAGARNETPVLVAYHIPDRDCGSYSAGGAASGDDYRTWIREFASGIKGRSVTVILEPDAVPHALEGCSGVADVRLALLADAVEVVKTASPNAVVYLDAGHPNWVKDIPKLAGALKRAGMARADGFSLNVSNFIRTAENVSYGSQLSEALGGAHFVIDTSRNGAGPYPSAEVNGGPGWCNPPGRALGTAPTTETGQPRVDAYLWIKRPGESDGACRPGEPVAGQWWPEYALSLAKAST